MSFVLPLLPVILPVVLCAGLGVIWAYTRQPFDQEFVRRLVMWIAAPALIVGTLGEVSMSHAVLREVVVASVLMIVLSLLLAGLVCLVVRQSPRDFLVPLVFGNYGNMGLPLCLFAFGEEGLVYALGIFVVTALLHFSLGVALLRGRGSVAGLLQTPIVYAGVVAFGLILFEIRLPVSLANTLDILGAPAVPLMLITLGISLGSLRVGGLGHSFLLGLLRLAVGLGGGVLTVWLLGLEGMLAKVLLVQSATPAAVFNYLLAVQYGRRPEAVAGIVVWSTVLSFVSIPLLLAVIGVG